MRRIEQHLAKLEPADLERVLSTLDSSELTNLVRWSAHVERARNDPESELSRFREDIKAPPTEPVSSHVRRVRSPAVIARVLEALRNAGKKELDGPRKLPPIRRPETGRESTPYDNPDWAKDAVAYGGEMLGRLSQKEMKELIALLAPKIERRASFPVTSHRPGTRAGTAAAYDPLGPVLAWAIAAQGPSGVHEALELVDRDNQLENIVYSAMQLEDDGAVLPVIDLYPWRGRNASLQPLLALVDAVGQSAPQCDRDYLKCGWAYGRMIQTVARGMRQWAYEYPVGVSGPKELYLAGKPQVAILLRHVAAMMGGRNGENAPHLVYWLERMDAHSLESLNEVMFYIQAQPETLYENLAYIARAMNDVTSPDEVLPLLTGPLNDFMKGLTCGYGAGPLSHGRRFDCIASGYPKGSPDYSSSHGDGIRQRHTLLGSTSRRSELSPNAQLAAAAISSIRAGALKVSDQYIDVATNAKEAYLPLALLKETARELKYKIPMEYLKFQNLAGKKYDKHIAALVRQTPNVALAAILPTERELWDSKAREHIVGTERNPRHTQFYQTFRQAFVNRSLRLEGRSGGSTSTDERRPYYDEFIEHLRKKIFE